jgi:ComF family protein
MVNGWLQHVQGALFPPSCILCGDRGQAPTLDLCRGCADDLPRNRNPCRQCATPLGSAEGPGLCGACIGRPPAFARAVAPYLYGYPLDHLVRTFKYDGALSYGRVLGTLLASHLAHEDPAPEVLLPVPLHVERHRERGFNQTIELARHVGSVLAIRVEPSLCERLRATDDQTELSARQRRMNVRGAFRLARRLRAKHVALLDDVMTTGSTAAEMAAELRRAGAERVDVWAVARATL